jgi:hypothetical protein
LEYLAATSAVLPRPSRRDILRSCGAIDYERPSEAEGFTGIPETRFPAALSGGSLVRGLKGSLRTQSVVPTKDTKHTNEIAGPRGGRMKTRSRGGYADESV